MKSRKEKVVRPPSVPALRDEELRSVVGGAQFPPGQFPGPMPPGQFPSEVKPGWHPGK